MSKSDIDRTETVDVACRRDCEHMKKVGRQLPIADDDNLKSDCSGNKSASYSVASCLPISLIDLNALLVDRLHGSS